ncbi:MAG: hypothetical protein RIH33_13615, partial [Marinoscillum sp.]
MKQFTILTLIVFLAGCSYQKSEEYDLVISNVNLIDGTGKPLQTGVSIGITEGKIVAIDSILLNSNGKS